MDTLTQMLLGAVVAQAGFRRRLGRRAIVAGAALAAVPDFDVVAGWAGGTFATWEHHRGLTHSILFGPIVGPFFGWLLWRLDARWYDRRWREPPPEALRSWMFLAVLVLFTHPLIDLFTSYGTQLLWPFSTARFAINALPIIDPVYSLILLAAVLCGAFLRVRARLAADVAVLALLAIFAYSLAGWALNSRIETIARADFARPASVSAYPLLFQPYYRRVVATTPQAAYIGYYSVLNPKPIEWREYAMARGPAVDAVKETREARIFDWFSMYNLLWTQRTTPDGATLVEAYDLRYGMPGTDLSFWGIRARVRDGASSPVEAFTTPRDASGEAFARFWSDMTGR